MKVLKHHKECVEGVACHPGCQVAAEGESQLPEFKKTSVNKKIDMILKQAEYISQEVKFQTILIQSLALFYDAVGCALDLQKHGHTDGWGTVQKMIDVIDDKYDLSIYLETKEKDYIVTVKQIVESVKLCNDDRNQNPSGRHGISALSKDDALDKFHSTIPISFPEHFEISIKEEKWHE